MQATKHNLTVILNEKTGSLSFLDGEGGLLLEQYDVAEGYVVENASATDGRLEFTVKRQGAAALCVVQIKGEALVTLDISGEGKLEGEFLFPAAIKAQSGESLVYPLCEGVMIPADDTVVPFPKRLNTSGGAHLSMGLLGLVRENGSWVLCANMTTADGALVTEREDGLLKSQLAWLPEKGQWGYTRSLRYVFGKSGSVGALGLAYREIAKEKGFVVPFSEKVKNLPNLEKLLGAADVWLWNDNAMELLYSEQPVYKVPTPEQNALRRKIAGDMKQSGMEKVLWSIFNENIDKETVDYVKSLGYITTFYDIYTDVIPHPIYDKIPKPRQVRCETRIGCWPDGVIRKVDGTLQEAWELKGIDGVFRPQHRLCDAAILETAKKNISERGEMYGIEGCFLDVSSVSASECYDERHPMTRTEAFYHKRRLSQAVSDLGQICGTEIGCEDVASKIHYNEGMMSPPQFRAPDSGRRMTHIYKGENVPENIKSFMLNPKYRVPLWELTFHGSVQSYWYWGDSANCCPELIEQRDRFSALYGLPQIYSFSVVDWPMLKNDILASYNRTTPLATKLSYATMDGFEYLTSDKMLQKTHFSDGTSVTVNFSDRDILLNGTTYRAGEIKVEG